MVEATAQTVGLSLEYSPAPLFRSQSSDYSLTAVYSNIDQVFRLVDGLEGYELTKFAREELADSLPMASQMEPDYGPRLPARTGFTDGG